MAVSPDDTKNSMSRKIAKAEVIHLRHRSLALKTLYPDQGYTTEDVAGSITLLSPARYGSKLNHSYGLGMFGSVTRDNLHVIEDVFEFDELLGVAAMAMIDAEDNKVAVLYIDSCLPRSRGRGVHKALLLERLRIAKDRGCDLAIASAREGSISAHNIEKVGLKQAYACKIYTKNH